MKEVTVDAIEVRLNALNSLVEIAYSEALDLPQPDDGTSDRARRVTDLLMFVRDEVERITADFAVWHSVQCVRGAKAA